MSALPPFLQVLKEALTAIDAEANHEASNVAALSIIEDYLRFFGAEGVDEDLWQLVVLALSSETAKDFSTGRDRHNLLFFYEYTLLFVRAVESLTNKADEHQWLQAEENLLWLAVYE